MIYIKEPDTEVAAGKTQKRQPVAGPMPEVEYEFLGIISLSNS